MATALLAALGSTALFFVLFSGALYGVTGGHVLGLYLTILTLMAATTLALATMYAAGTALLRKRRGASGDVVALRDRRARSKDQAA